MKDRMTRFPEQVLVSRSMWVSHTALHYITLHYAVAQKRVPKCPEDHLVTIVKTWTNDGTRVLSVIKAEFPNSNQSCIASLAFEFRNTCTSQSLPNTTQSLHCPATTSFVGAEIIKLIFWLYNLLKIDISECNLFYFS